METHHLYDVIFRLSTLPEALTDKHYRTRLTTALDERLAITEHRHRYLLLNTGHISDYMYFVERGIARCFYIDDQTGRELTSMIWKEQSIVCDPVSFFQRRVSDVNIEVMPGALLVSISYRQLEDIYKAFPEAEVFSRCISLQYVYHHAQRARELVGASPWERYRRLLKTHPGIELSLPKEIIASYLNITPQTLTKMIRRRGHP